jgi:glycosyltransferase involved in cell wall biosynthesis
MQRATARDGVSVIIPVYNDERHIGEALESVIAQTYGPIEVIVIDDGSTDGTARIVGQFPLVTYHYQANGGSSAARNRGVSLSRNRLLAFLDSDDLWFEDKLMRQVRVLSEHAEVDAVFGHVRQFVSPELLPTLSGRQTNRLSDPMPGLLTSTMLIKREAFLRVGPFEVKWRHAEWPDWYARSLEGGLIAVMLEEVVALRRIHKTNKGIVQRALVRDYARVLKASLDRRRARAASSGTPGRDE